MATLAKNLEARLRAGLRAAGLPDFPIEVAPTSDFRHGDYQTNLALLLGKALETNPREIATRIVQQVSESDLGPPPEIAGPGFINFRLNADFVGRFLLEMAGDERLGVERSASPKTIVIDFSSPNIAKPMHVGHIRSTMLGDALARISRFLGHRVITDNHVGDWGTQFGKLIYGWQHFLDPAALADDAMRELVRLYRETESLSKQDPAVLEVCRENLVKLQQGEPEMIEIWKKCVELSESEFARIYARLDISFDEQLGESFYHPWLPEVAEELLKRGVAEESQGAVVYWDRSLSGDPFIIRKSDGGFGYAATDVATLRNRFDRWRPDGIWYVVGAPQRLHFQLLFSLARKLGYTLELAHIEFGSILGTDRKLMRTRSGDQVPLKELLDEAVERAIVLVREKNPQLSAEEQQEIGRIVGIGAVKYAELSQHRTTNYVFSWDKLLALQGNTAPYLQNAFVRSRAIFRRLQEEFGRPTKLQLIEPAELSLGKKLLLFPEIVPAVLSGFKPNILANYLYELAAEYHGFYEICPVLTAAEPARSTRLLLCELFSRVLKTGLGFLGIDVPERM
jgi:arginyl-tRNA synthetase